MQVGIIIKGNGDYNNNLIKNDNTNKNYIYIFVNTYIYTKYIY